MLSAGSPGVAGGGGDTPLQLQAGAGPRDTRLPAQPPAPPGPGMAPGLKRARESPSRTPTLSQGSRCKSVRPRQCSWLSACGACSGRQGPKDSGRREQRRPQALGGDAAGPAPTPRAPLPPPMLRMTHEQVHPGRSPSSQEIGQRQGWGAAACAYTSRGALRGGSFLAHGGNSQDTQKRSGWCRGGGWYSAPAAPSRTSVYVGWSRAQGEPLCLRAPGPSAGDASQC